MLQTKSRAGTGVSDHARAAYELIRGAADSDAAAVPTGMITATVKINAGCNRLTYNAVGFSAGALDASARDLYDDEPVGVTVMVRA